MAERDPLYGHRLLVVLSDETGHAPEDFSTPHYPWILEVESDGDAPGWRLDIGRGCFSLTREVGWYVQSGEGKTADDLRTLIQAFEAADEAMCKVLEVTRG